MLKQIESEIESSKNIEKAKILQRFFKTGVGQYGEGDIFFGITVPIQRKIAKKYVELKLKEIQLLLNSKIHEKRLIALLILIQKYKKAQESEKEKIFNFYIKNTRNVNNWDLVDLSAPNIVGDYLLNKERKMLYKFAISKNIWERRISIISTLALIRNFQFEYTINISKILVNDKHDLIQKAVGWMLRELGKRDETLLVEFLKTNYQKMPRTMLRYSIEKFSKEIRSKYLKGEI
jgi:3-methyladenine DNA glycosylase AlkD